MRKLAIAIVACSILVNPVHASEPVETKRGMLGAETIITMIVMTMAFSAGRMWESYTSGENARGAVAKHCEAVSDNEIVCDIPAVAQEHGTACVGAGDGKVRCIVPKSIVEDLR